MSAADGEQIDGDVLTIVLCDTVLVETGDRDRTDPSRRALTCGAADGGAEDESMPVSSLTRFAAAEAVVRESMTAGMSMPAACRSETSS